jgi:hypothetical protein
VQQFRLGLLQQNSFETAPGPPQGIRVVLAAYAFLLKGSFESQFEITYIMADLELTLAAGLRTSI